jgi:hypothetical protein
MVMHGTHAHVLTRPGSWSAWASGPGSPSPGCSTARRSGSGRTRRARDAGTGGLRGPGRGRAARPGAGRGRRRRRPRVRTASRRWRWPGRTRGCGARGGPCVRRSGTGWARSPPDMAKPGAVAGRQCRSDIRSIGRHRALRKWRAVTARCYAVGRTFSLRRPRCSRGSPPRRDRASPGRACRRA